VDSHGFCVIVELLLGADGTAMDLDDPREEM
jgi:hypothetical protein